MGEDPLAVLDERRAVLGHALAKPNILLEDGLGFGHGVGGLLHAVHGPHEVHGRGPCRAQSCAGGGVFEGGRAPVREGGQAGRGRHADERCAAHGQALDQADHDRRIAAVQPQFRIGELRLIQHPEGAAVVAEAEGFEGVHREFLLKDALKIEERLSQS